MIRLFFATHDGQSGRIAGRLAKTLTASGAQVQLADLGLGLPAPEEIATAPVVAVVGAVRYGHHLKPADDLLALCARTGRSGKLAVASVNLTARKEGRDSLETNPYLRKWLERHRLAPELATAFAGKLDYPRYSWLDRQMIRLIMTITKGPTDPAATIEFTDWDKVDAFARRVGDLARAG